MEILTESDVLTGPSRAAREARLAQQARVFWLYGLSGAGKTSLGRGLERTLFARGFTTAFLDGDELRTGLNAGLGYSLEARTENVRRAAEVARLFLDAGLVVIAAFMTPAAAQRDLARAIVGSADFDEVFVDCSVGRCEQRDVKGLYAQSRQRRLTDLPGKTLSFERPSRADLVVNTEVRSYDACLDALTAHAVGRIAPEPRLIWNGQ